MKKFSGKVVLVTGGGRGIGRAVATAFAQEGSDIVITNNTELTLEETKNFIEQTYSVRVLAMVADGADHDAVVRVVDKIREDFGRLDCVVNNAQASKSGKLLVEHSKEDFDLAINSGLYATFYYMKECFELLKQSKGCVLNFASNAGMAGQVGQSSYAAAKEGIRGLSRVAANEWGQYGVRVNVVCPLAMTEQLQAWRKEYPDLYEKTITNIPLRRFGDPVNDIGRVCVFLASEDASFISGETISVQGGAGLRP
ncbi:MAG: SDR family oxidoreductase [Paludibacteraceae bacterium]|nr:SDR family oxidoreductase [Prevotellaceae bacterium]